MKTPRPRTLRTNTKTFAAKVVAVKTMLTTLVLGLGGFHDNRDGHIGADHIALVLPTLFGTLRICMIGTDSTTIFTRFTEPERASSRVSSNGKWNFHGFDRDEVKQIQATMALELGLVALIAEKREDGRAAAHAWIAADDRRREVWGAGLNGHMDGSRGKEANPVPASVGFEAHAAYMKCYTREFTSWRAKQGPGIVATKPDTAAVAVA